MAGQAEDAADLGPGAQGLLDAADRRNRGAGEQRAAGRWNGRDLRGRRIEGDDGEQDVCAGEESVDPLGGLAQGTARREVGDPSILDLEAGESQREYRSAQSEDGQGE